MPSHVDYSPHPAALGNTLRTAAFLNSNTLCTHKEQDVICNVYLPVNLQVSLFCPWFLQFLSHPRVLQCPVKIKNTLDNSEMQLRLINIHVDVIMFSSGVCKFLTLIPCSPFGPSGPGAPIGPSSPCS